MRKLLALLTLMYSSLSMADGIVVDKVYHPYILPNERKLEWRFMSRQSDNGNLLGQRLAYGQALGENLIMEGYLAFERDTSDDFGLAAYEVEVRWQLSEQGKNWADWGVLFEVEKQHQTEVWEANVGLLMEKEFYRSSLTVNLFTVYEFGSQIRDEFETELRAQYRYRLHPAFQPAIELYTGEDFIGIGPGLMGVHRYEGQKQLKYEIAFISGINGDTKDHTLRFALEWEF
ncbi:hypothetical protein [Bowmanella sp. JS7-9]|uniref:MetA-pathway of phenol degradation n=1 Tax=Pseudobowmanella zhangzhouensis TaxID=1537679 RepID=A0ABW1XJ50_9ALTE|nr:hypothetical protein [Bowmanella sp. JS7-9]TBX23085.1 hypothetical protein TK45_07615 [Bowmanella sp. JS7-9]